MDIRDESMSTSRIVVGVDVGSHGKGFHAVGLQDDAYLDRFTARDPRSLTRWCLEIKARVVAIDAPCRWSVTGRARPAERELAKEGIYAFATPTRQGAESRAFYRWMQNGIALYEAIEPHYQLFDGRTWNLGQVCFETFPHAVACALAGKIVSATQKRIIRRELLREAGIDTRRLTNIDTIDAALCALAANHFLAGNVKTYGDASEGFIVVPGYCIRKRESVSGSRD